MTQLHQKPVNKIRKSLLLQSQNGDIRYGKTPTLDRVWSQFSAFRLYLNVIPLSASRSTFMLCHFRTELYTRPKCAGLEMVPPTEQNSSVLSRCDIPDCDTDGCVVIEMGDCP